MYLFIKVLYPITFLLLVSCSNEKDIMIGDQIWATKNLDTKYFKNGDEIYEAKSIEDWEEAGKNRKAAFCCYQNNAKNCKTFGKIYNWFAVNDKRGLAPNGYRLPSDSDFVKLISFLGGDTLSSYKLKLNSSWKKHNEVSTNLDVESGFKGLPGGSR